MIVKKAASILVNRIPENEISDEMTKAINEFVNNELVNNEEYMSLVIDKFVEAVMYHMKDPEPEPVTPEHVIYDEEVDNGNSGDAVVDEMVVAEKTAKKNHKK